MGHVWLLLTARCTFRLGTLLGPRLPGGYGTGFYVGQCEVEGWDRVRLLHASWYTLMFGSVLGPRLAREREWVCVFVKMRVRFQKGYGFG